MELVTMKLQNVTFIVKKKIHYETDFNEIVVSFAVEDTSCFIIRLHNVFQQVL